MHTFTILILLARGLLSDCAPVGKPFNHSPDRNLDSSSEIFTDASAHESKVDNWNAAAWSNFVKVYAVDDNEPVSVRRDAENWNAAAWSNFVKVYAVDDEEESTSRT
jgi:hypothetical protein